MSSNRKRLTFKCFLNGLIIIVLWIFFNLKGIKMTKFSEFLSFSWLYTYWLKYIIFQIYLCAEMCCEFKTLITVLKNSAEILQP